jgi:hypothetical protein
MDYNDPTAIGAVVKSNSQGTTNLIYDLQGRRKEHPTKGLYIVNGQKVVMK